jgi:phage terminase small subunit
MANKELTPQQRMFIAEYLVDLNATKAAERAGYSAKTAKSQGSRLLTNVDIAAEIEKAVSKREKRTALSADFVLDGIRETTIEARAAAEFAPALKGYELLGKHLKLFTEKREIKFDLDNISDEQLAELESKLAAAESGPAGTGTP